jgi:hypothetical protein
VHVLKQFKQCKELITTKTHTPTEKKQDYWKKKRAEPSFLLLSCPCP